MIDFHTHVLPGIDDGSDSTSETIRMLEEEKAQGIDLVCATPHFYAHRRSVDKFIARRNASFAHIREKAADRLAGLPEIRLGAEVYYFPGMGRAEQLNELTLEGTDVILIEMPFEQWDSQVLRDVEDIIYRRKMRVVLAHVERYVFLQRDKGIWDAVMDLPLYIQLNAGSFLRMGKTKRFCLGQVKAQDNVILGTDCHNMTDRLPNMAEAIKVIEKKAGAGAVSEMMDNARGLVR